MTTTYGAGGPVELDDGSLRIFADRGDHHAMLVVPRSVIVAGGGDAVALVVSTLDAMLDDLEAQEANEDYRDPVQWNSRARNLT